MTSAYSVGVIRGDGTGPEVVGEALKVLEAVGDGFDVELVEFDLGAERYLRTGEVLPDGELERLRSVDAVLLGAVGDPRVRPGILERDLLLRIRCELDPYVNLRLSTRLQVNVGPSVSRSINHTQWFGNFTDDGGVTHYSFAHLDQRTLSMRARLNYTVTPNLTFEFYGQPFVSRGEYSDVREVSATPHAERYADRFVSYTPPPTAKMAFKVTQLRTNTVLRWEYRPGSTLFVVWTHGRFDDENRNPDQSWSRDYRDLFTLHPENTFLVKVAYWLNR